MYVFDASSIVNLIKKGVARVFAEGVTLDLALYESINAIWKEYVLLKRIDKDTAKDFIEVISRLFKVVDLVSIRNFEGKVFTLASKEDLTIYDASYLYVAIKDGLTLVTDDQSLREKALKYVKAISSSKLV